jgi:hypothetical protein
MALEINEIGIHIQVSERGNRPDADAAGQSQNGAPQDRDEIVAECVRRVLQALKSHRER